MIRLRRVALEEYDDAVTWYERRRPGLGALFAKRVTETMNRIEGSPLSFPRVREDTRRAVVPRFPYGVFFRLEGQDIVVLAILHASRDPSRLDRRS